MIIEISGEGQLVLRDADGFSGFSVRLTGGTFSTSRPELLGRVGVVDGPDHVWIEPATVRSLAGARAQDANWLARSAGMVGYAHSRGWVDASGRIRAHVEIS
jgi:hypothetical protein